MARFIPRDYSKLIGEKINKWTVLDFDQEMSKELGVPCMKCQCECGVIKGVRAKDLYNGKSKSCGCLQRQRTSEATFKDLTGKRFGRLLVLGIDWEKTTPGHYYYICQCDCGTIVSVDAHNLRSGVTKSCGCLKYDVSHRENEILINEQYNYGVCFFNTNDKYFIFDLENLDIVKAHCWRLSNGYATTNIKDENGVEHHVSFHRIVMERKYGNIDDYQIDHIDHNTLDDRYINMRLCTREQNQTNRKSAVSNTGERNISYISTIDRYSVNIESENPKRFITMEEAIEYRDQYIMNHPNMFRYDPNQDIRNITNINPDGSIVPFVNINGRPIRVPFIIVD